MNALTLKTENVCSGIRTVLDTTSCTMTDPVAIFEVRAIATTVTDPCALEIFSVTVRHDPFARTVPTAVAFLTRTGCGDCASTSTTANAFPTVWEILTAEHTAPTTNAACVDRRLIDETVAVALTLTAPTATAVLILQAVVCAVTTNDPAANGSV